MVYHYTTVETLCNMFSTYKDSKDKDHLVFWASSALHQNDEEEISLRFNDILSIICDIENNDKIGRLDDFKKLSNAQQQNWIPSLTGQGIDLSFDEFLCSTEYAPFTISFSRQRDKLLMWSLYAKNGNGICMAFDENQLVCEQESLCPLADIVVYGKENTESYKNVVKMFYEKYKDDVKNDSIINIIYQKKKQYIMSTLWAISPFIKNVAFKEEDEFRIAFLKEENEKPKVYTRMTSKLNEIEYVKVKVPISALNHIIIGPCADYEATKQLLEKNMQSCHINRDYENNFFQKSVIPFRQL